MANIGAHSMTFFLLVCMRCIEQEMANKVTVKFAGNKRPDVVAGEFAMNDVMKLVECMPDEILPLYRRQRSYVNSVLAGHEIDSNHPYNKKLFKRTSRGYYILNPSLVYNNDGA